MGIYHKLYVFDLPSFTDGTISSSPRACAVSPAAISARMRVEEHITSPSITGGTITGVGEYLKEQNPDIQVVALEPEDSPVLSEGRSGAHKIQGIGAGFVPDVLNTKVYDEVFKASNQDAFNTSRLLAKKEGISVGISSGAALFGAIQLAKRPENKGKVIVALLPDSGDRYYSTALFTE